MNINTAESLTDCIRKWEECAPETGIEEERKKSEWWVGGKSGKTNSRKMAWRWHSPGGEVAMVKKKKYPDGKAKGKFKPREI